MVLIALGANLPSRHGSPRETLTAALAALDALGLRVARRSAWYGSAPVPPSGQPDFVNAVAALDTQEDPATVLRQLHAVEARFDRRRTVPNAARTIDLDLLDHHGIVTTDWPVLPHPRLHERLFVLRPLGDVAPGWRHPVTGRSIAELLAAVPPGQIISRIEE